ncbi:sensor histidine kinase [Nonomuraea sp. NPDC002799]
MPASGADRWDVVARARAMLDGLEQLVQGLGTAVLALVTLGFAIATAVLCLVGVGLLLIPTVVRLLRVVGDRERARLSNIGPEVIAPEEAPGLATEATRRELIWLVIHALYGLFLGLMGVSFPIYVLRDATFPLWWWMLPPEEAATAAMGLWQVTDAPGALAVSLLALAWVVVSLVVFPAMARLQAWPGRKLLAPPAGADLALRVQQLTATRANALDAHATELRRIERSLHDGTQNRLVAVTVLIGAARRARDPAAADELLERAQAAAELALGDLRGVVRSILPPVLTDRSLADALTGLAAACPVLCRVEADIPVRCAVSVEAAAYFVVAEALTNIAKHSQARKATVTARRGEGRLHLSITDDGLGGADEHQGSGLVGIRHRIEAHDGTFMLDSPVGGPTRIAVSLPCGS